jgi:hypothetical protein
MIEPTRLPHRVFGVMRQELDATLGHLAGLDSGDGEGCRPVSRLGLDRALHLEDRPHAKARIRQAPILGARIRCREGCQMHAGIARERRVEFLDERGVGSLEQHFEIPARHHRRDVAGPGRLQGAVGRTDLDGDRGGGEARRYERIARRGSVGDEMREMIEKDLVTERELTVHVLRPHAAALNDPPGGRDTSPDPPRLAPGSS